MEKVVDMVSGEYILQWVIVAILLLYFVYKEWPEFKKRMKSWGKQEEQEKSLNQRVSDVETELKKVNEKLDNDYRQINTMVQELQNQKRVTDASLEEREIIMRSLLGVLKGLQEIGANGPTKEAQAEIETYLNKQAHEPK